MEEFVVYPNPVDGSRIIYLYSDMLVDGGLSRVNIYDLKGSRLKEHVFDSQPDIRPVEINVSALTPGTYILTCENNNKSKKSKIVIQ